MQDKGVAPCAATPGYTAPQCGPGAGNADAWNRLRYILRKTVQIAEWHQFSRHGIGYGIDKGTSPTAARETQALQVAKAPKNTILEDNIMAEEKVRFQMRIDPDTDRKIKSAMPLANCRSQNEFVETALRFYCDYLTAGDCTAVAPMYLSAIRGTVQDTENRICRLLFKLAVEQDMVMNVLAAGMEIPDEQLKALRGRCVQNVKKTGGSVTLDDAVRYQNGGL